MQHLSKIPFHPLLFALFPILTLYAYNIHEVSSSVIWRPLAISLVAAALLLGILRLIFRDWHRAAFLASVLLIIFFSYGRIYDALKSTSLVDLNIVHHRYLVVVFLCLFILLAWLTLRYLRDCKPVSGFLNIISIVMVILAGTQIAAYLINTSSGERATARWSKGSSLISTARPGDQPDVYLIILDLYVRADVLYTDLGFDNSDFIQQLESMGFYVASCSRSNYSNTASSMVSSLNMNYLPELIDEAAEQGISPSNLWLLIKSNLVRKIFESLGYRTVAFDTGYRWTSLDDVDIYLTRDQNVYGVQFISPFEQMLVDSTALSIYSDYLTRANRQKYYGASHYDANYIGLQEFILDQLPKVAEINAPTFTYAHISVTHPPFVFSPEGYLSNLEPEQTNDIPHFPQSYILSIEYLNPRIISIIQEILDKSTVPPIIILQGDHGYWERGKDGGINQILNAYYLPGLQDGKLYPSISPVNTFRLVFNEYFGGRYKMLPDESFNIKYINTPLPEDHPDCQK